MAGLRDFEVRPAGGEERLPPGIAPAAAVERLAGQKCAEVAAKYDGETAVIASDTVVAIDGMILGKPADETEAAEMLRRLSGRTHRVYSGLAVAFRGETVLEHEETDVTFRTLTESEIAAYVDSGEPMDKAGAYGIQGRGGIFVRGIAGDYYNVMGLPLCRLVLILRRLGVDLL
jgi:septum formation protein